MRVWTHALFLAGTLLTACSDGSSSTENAGGGGSGGAATTSEGGGGVGAAGAGSTGTSTDTSSTASTTGETTTGETTSTTAASDPCDGSGDEPVLFATEVQPIFSQSCGSATTCHLKSVPSEGLNLKPGAAYASLVDVPAKQQCNGQKRVVPGDAAASYLVNKVTATDVCPTTKKMPPSGSISAASKQKIIDWICQGAQNN